MNKIIVYSKEEFKGKPEEFKYDVSDIEKEGFKDGIGSIKVTGKAWVAYYDKCFAGKQQVFEEGGTYNKLGGLPFSSLKMISDDLAHPNIQLYEFERYKGRSMTVSKETNLEDIRTFGPTAKSHKVLNGVWVLYDQYKGSELIAFAGNEVPKYDPSFFSDAVYSVRPLMPTP